MEDSTIIKPLREQFKIFIKYLQSEQCATSQLNLTRRSEKFGINLLKFAQISQKIYIIDI